MSILTDTYITPYTLYQNRAYPLNNTWGSTNALTPSANLAYSPYSSSYFYQPPRPNTVVSPQTVSPSLPAANYAAVPINGVRWVLPALFTGVAATLGLIIIKKNKKDNGSTTLTTEQSKAQATPSQLSATVASKEPIATASVSKTQTTVIENARQSEPFSEITPSESRKQHSSNWPKLSAKSYSLAKLKSPWVWAMGTSFGSLGYSLVGSHPIKPPVGANMPNFLNSTTPLFSNINKPAPLEFFPILEPALLYTKNAFTPLKSAAQSAVPPVKALFEGSTHIPSSTARPATETLISTASNIFKFLKSSVPSLNPLASTASNGLKQAAGAATPVINHKVDAYFSSDMVYTPLKSSISGMIKGFASGAAFPMLAGISVAGLGYYAYKNKTDSATGVHSKESRSHQSHVPPTIIYDWKREIERKAWHEMQSEHSDLFEKWQAKLNELKVLRRSASLDTLNKVNLVEAEAQLYQSLLYIKTMPHLIKEAERGGRIYVKHRANFDILADGYKKWLANAEKQAKDCELKVSAYQFRASKAVLGADIKAKDGIGENVPLYDLLRKLYAYPSATRKEFNANPGVYLAANQVLIAIRYKEWANQKESAQSRHIPMREHEIRLKKTYETLVQPYLEFLKSEKPIRNKLHAAGYSEAAIRIMLGMA